MSLNRVMLSGNLTRSPELKATTGGTSVLTFGVAVNDRRRNPQTGEWEDVPNFVDCVVFGARAEPLSRFLSKGSKVAIEGKLRYSSWETQDGSKRSKLEVVVDEVEFLSPRNDQQQAPAYSAPQQAPAYSAPAYSAPAPQYSAPAPQYAAPQPQAPVQQQYVQPEQFAQVAQQLGRRAPQQQAMQQPDLYDQDIPF